jgi:AAA+ superfamily predicted ATPase
LQKKEGMEKTNKQRLLDAIGWLYEKSENSKLTEAFFEQAPNHLVKNLDTAFKRRFLFKVEMKKPGRDARARIWKLKLPHLTTQQCEALAAQFDFSGGQIDNIARKQAIHEVIHDTTPDFDQIEAYCRDEMLEKSGSVRIGYVKLPG